MTEEHSGSRPASATRRMSEFAETCAQMQDLKGMSTFHAVATAAGVEEARKNENLAACNYAYGELWSTYQMALAECAQARDAVFVEPWRRPLASVLDFRKSHASWSDTRRVVTSEVRNGLKAAAIHVETISPSVESEREVSTDDLLELEMRVAHLIEELEQADYLPERLREILQKQASRIELALNMYSVVGLSGLEEALAAAVGGAFCRFSYLSSPEAGSVGKAFLEVTKYGFSLLRTYAAVKALDTGAVQKLLGG